METFTVDDSSMTSESLIITASTNRMINSARDIEVENDVIFHPNVSAVYGALYAIVVVPALLVNILIILAFFRYSHLRTSINTYIVNLAVCDLCLVTFECFPIITQYLVPTKWSSNVVNDVFCTFSFFFNTFFGTAGIMTLLALSVERFCSVLHPVTTMAFATRTQTRANFILVLVWCVTILPHFGNCVLFDSVKRERHSYTGGVYDVTFCVSAKADDNLFYGSFYTATIFFLLYASAFVTTLAIYVKIIRKLKKRNLERFQDGSRRHRHHTGRRSSHDRALKQTVKLVLFSVVSYLVCYSFYFYVNLYYVYFGLYKRQGFSLILIANWFGALNACLNPIMHAVFVSKFRRGLKSFLLCKRSGLLRSDSDRIPDSNHSSVRTVNTLSLENHIMPEELEATSVKEDQC